MEKGKSWSPFPPRTETKEVQPFFKLAVMGSDQSDTHSCDLKSWELDKKSEGLCEDEGHGEVCPDQSGPFLLPRPPPLGWVLPFLQI